MADAISKVNFVLGKSTSYSGSSTGQTASVSIGNAQENEISVTPAVASSVQQSVAAAVAESPIVSNEAERVRIETESAAINKSQAQAELVRSADRDKQQQVSAIDASTKTDARQYVGGTSHSTTNIITPSSSKNDLDYYFAH